MGKFWPRVFSIAGTDSMADTASYRVTPIVSLVPILDFITTEGSVHGSSEISGQGASWTVFIEDTTGVFIRVFLTSAFAMDSVIGVLITVFITRAFTAGAFALGLTSNSAS